MKRLTLLLSLVASLALVVGCNTPQEKFMDAEGITATFNVALPGEMPTKAISDGNAATELLFKVYDAQGRPLPELDQKVTVSGKRATITAKLVRGVAYKFVFWAQKPGQYTITDGKVTIAANKLPSMMNNDAFDAFYALKEVSAQEADFSADVTLYRPFAQINVGASPEDIANAQANALDLTGSLKTAFTLKGVKNTLDLITGNVTGNENVTYTATVAPTDNITTTDGAAYRRIAMVYVLAGPQSSTLPVTVNVATKQSGTIDVAFAREVPNVPVRRNHRTNIVGEIFSLKGTFNVIVDANFDRPDTEVQIDVPAPTPVTYTVTVQESILNGSVAIAGSRTEFEEGETVSLVATPNENYELSYLAYTTDQGGVATEINLKTLQFPMPASNVKVTARFAYVEPGPTPGGEGSGTADDPYTVAGVRAFIDGLGQAGTVSENPVYVKGVVSRIASAPSTQYSNASFYMTDPNGTDEFEAFRINFFNDKPWKVDDPMVAVGDEVVVFGKVMLYASNNTYETYQKKDEYNGYLISINGMDNVMTSPTITAKDASGATTTVIPANGSLTVNIYAAKSADIRYTTDGSTPTKNSTQFTSDFTVSDACTVKAIAFADGSLPSAVASLTLTKESGPTPGGEGSGTADDPYTVAGVRAFIDGLGAAGTISDNEVFVKGVIKSIPNNGQFNTQFGNASFYMTDPNGSDEFEAFRIYYFGNRPWVEGDALVEVGQEAVVCGRVTLYTNASSGAQTYETYQKADEYAGYLVSLDGKTGAATMPTISAADASGASTTVIPAASGSYLTVTITGSNIRYTTDGSEPTASSAAYSAPFRVTEACTIKAISLGDATTLDSGVASLTITKSSSTGTYPPVATQTFTFSSMGFSNGEEVSSISNTSNCSIVFDKGTNSNTPKYYTTGSAIRVYGGGTVTITAAAGYEISNIVFTFASGEGTNEITANKGTYSKGAWTGSISNGESVVFTVGGTSGHRRVASIKIN